MEHKECLNYRDLIFDLTEPYMFKHFCTYYEMTKTIDNYVLIGNMLQIKEMERIFGTVKLEDDIIQNWIISHSKYFRVVLDKFRTLQSFLRKHSPYDYKVSYQHYINLLDYLGIKPEVFR